MRLARGVSRAAGAALVAALAAVACSGAETLLSIEQTTFAPGLGVDLAASTKTASGLYYRDITVGDSAATTVTAGKTIFVHYTGYFTNGSIFDTNRAPTTPFSFIVGNHTVIAGFDEGVVGMKVGGTRQLILPPDLAYGAAGNSIIPPNSILVFSVTVVSSN